MTVFLQKSAEKLVTRQNGGMEHHLMSGDLCISTYAEYMRRGLGTNSDEETYDILFTWAIHKWDVNGQRGNELQIDKTEASKLNKRQKEINSSLREILRTTENYHFIKEHFRNKIVPMLGTDKFTLFHNLYVLAMNDIRVADVDKLKFQSLYDNISESDNQTEFLAYMFVVAVGKPNELPQWTSEDMKYLMEVRGYCPLCGKLMKYAFEKRNGCDYKIINIYPETPPGHLNLYDLPEEFENIPLPENSDDFSNKIAVHKKCAAAYEVEPSFGQYNALRMAKDNIIKNQYELDVLEILKNNAKVIEKLDLIIKNLNGLNKVIDESIIPRMKAVDIENKIKPEYSYLISEIKDEVLLYREKIWFLLLQYEKEGLLSSKTIMKKMASAYDNLRETGLPQTKIFDGMAKWIADSLNLGDDALRTCRLIVAFFVQNCEVFDVITE